MHPTWGVAVLLLRPPLLKEAHNQLVVRAPHKLWVAEPDQNDVFVHYNGKIKLKIKKILLTMLSVFFNY